MVAPEIHAERGHGARVGVTAGPQGGDLPRCGTYRTTTALPGDEEHVPEGSLVYFHDHSEPGPPQVLVPERSEHNRWHFGGARLVRDEAWPLTLVRLLPQGFYSLRRDLAFDGGRWPRGALVQLGYTRAAEPVLFLAQQRAELTENVLHFGTQGVPLPREQLALLDALVVFVEPGSALAAQEH